MKVLRQIFGTIVALTFADVLLASRTFTSGVEPIKVLDTYRGDDNVEVIWLPGVLIRPEDQLAPIVNMVARSSLTGIKYAGQVFDSNLVVSQVARLVKYRLDKPGNVQVVMYGASMGGNVALLVKQYLIDELCFDRDDLDHRLETVLIDMPYGAPSLVQLPRHIEPLLPFIFKVFRPGPIFNATIGRVILHMTQVPPKAEDILIPDKKTRECLVGRSNVTTDDFRAYAIQRAIDGMSGHLFSMLWSHLRFMIDFPSCGLSQSSNVSHVTCLRHGHQNNIVRQPQTELLLEGRKLVNDNFEVDSQHCGFLEALPNWARVFRSLNGRLFR